MSLLRRDPIGHGCDVTVLGSCFTHTPTNTCSADKLLVGNSDDAGCYGDVSWAVVPP